MADKEDGYNRGPLRARTVFQVWIVLDTTELDFDRAQQVFYTYRDALLAVKNRLESTYPGIYSRLSPADAYEKAYDAHRRWCVREVDVHTFKALHNANSGARTKMLSLLLRTLTEEQKQMLHKEGLLEDEDLGTVLQATCSRLAYD